MTLFVVELIVVVREEKLKAKEVHVQKEERRQAMTPMIAFIDLRCCDKSLVISADIIRNTTALPVYYNMTMLWTMALVRMIAY